jgi:hypothetical protein
MTFDTAKLFLELAGWCLIVHFAASIALRWNTRADSPLIDRLFASSLWGSAFSKKPWRFQAKYFWPLVPAPVGLSTRPAADRILFWAARLAGLGTAAFLLAFLVTAVSVGMG